MNSNNWFLLITIIFAATLTGCPNYVGPDETGRICEPGSMTADSFGCLPGCDLDASAYFCTADGRGQECRIVAGRVCRTDPGCPGGGAECGAGIGACLRFGTTSCPAGSSVANICSAVAGTPGAEICGDTIDNDCDGVVDDGCSTCVPTGAEICDNVDNNCSGAIDEGCDDDNDDHCDGTMQMGPSGSIHCPRTPPGRTTGDDCDDTNPGRCPSAVEICGNGIDEDCSGADLVCPPTCTYRGPEVCGNGVDDDCVGGDLVCSCVATIEVCDNVDNDCDGTRDDGVTQACYTGTSTTRGVGACRDGVATCSAGTFGSCVGQILPVTEVCGDAIDNDCDGVNNEGCSTCTYRGPEVCGNGIDDDCVGGDLVCTPVCGGAAVGTEICVSYGYDMPPLATYGLATVIDADITIFGCDGVPRTIRIDSVTRQACIPISASCQGWLATTYSEGSFSDLNNIGSWYAPSGASYLGMNASDPRLSGTLTSVSNIRVWARRPGLADRELTDRSWIANDPSGATVPSYSRSHVGERVARLMVPVREECTVSTARPPDRY